MLNKEDKRNALILFLFIRVVVRIGLIGQPFERRRDFLALNVV